MSRFGLTVALRPCFLAGSGVVELVPPDESECDLRPLVNSHRSQGPLSIEEGTVEQEALAVLIEAIQNQTRALMQIAAEINVYVEDCRERDKQFRNRVMPEFFRAGGMVYPSTFGKQTKKTNADNP